MGRTWVPVVPSGWTAGQPVKMVVEVRNMHWIDFMEKGLSRAFYEMCGGKVSVLGTSGVSKKWCDCG